MTDPLTAIAKVATSPAQAQIFVSMLAAKGIPAHIEGDSLADEVAVSRRMMNLSGVKVMVPASSLERAKLILKPEEVDEDELAELAMRATEGAETPPPPREERPRSGAKAITVAVVTSGAAILFLLLWIGEATKYQDNPLFRMQYEQGDWNTYLRRTGKLLYIQQDADRDGILEQTISYSPTGSWKSVADNLDSDGFERRVTITRDQDLIVTWSRDDATTPFNQAVVTDSTGKVYQTITWQPQVGFVVEKP